jgi:hypothetical protein
MKLEAVWSDLLTPDERAALDPGVPDDLSPEAERLDPRPSAVS